MSSAAFILNIVFASIITLIFLYRCGNFRRQHPITTIAVFISWLFSALFIFVLPLDISHTTYLDCVRVSIRQIFWEGAEFSLFCRVRRMKLVHNRGRILIRKFMKAFGMLFIGHRSYWLG